MATKTASSPSDSPSSTNDEIVPVEATDHSSTTAAAAAAATEQIAATSRVNNKENEKPASTTSIVADQPKSKKKEPSTVTSSSCFPFKSRHENPKPKSIGDKPTSAAAEPRSNETNPNTATSSGDGKIRSNDTNPNENNNSSNQPSQNKGESEVELLSRLVKADLKLINGAKTRLDHNKDGIDMVSKRHERLVQGRGNETEFRELKKVVKKLKQKISSKHKDEAEESIIPMGWSDAAASTVGEEAANILEKMPDLIKNDEFENTLEFKEFEASYNELEDVVLKICLLSFSVFPENVEIKKRVVIYWWIGEGFVAPLKGDATDKKTAEQFAKEYFDKLVAKGFIDPVRNKRSIGVDIVKMQPFVRSMVIKLAMRAKFFDFDEEGNAVEGCSRSLRACLTGENGLSKIENLEKLHALFNIEEGSLEFKPEWFAKIKNVNVLYLGRWQTSARHHIEVEDTQTMKVKKAHVLDGLEHLKYLRFLSLQGISQIMKLPDSISKLPNLTILDIRACYSLEEIPEGIGLLKNLTHLDMSECYLLDHMPKGLASLLKLEVLSGFVVGDSDGKNSCTIQDLLKLKYLRKLSIHTGVNDFPREEDLCALYKYEALTKLTIAWGRASEAEKQNNSGGNLAAAGTPERENGEDNKNRVADEAASKKAGTSKQSPRTPTEDSKSRDIGQSSTPAVQRSQTRTSTSTQSPRTPNGEKREETKSRDISQPSTPAGKLKKAISKSFTFKAREEPEKPIAALPLKLKKLDLQCFPRITTPDWMKADKLKKLQKLYIRGGKFSDLGQFEEFDSEEAGEGTEKATWEVEELRLKYLTEMEMDWMELQELFPKMTYLEKVKCPRLTLFPCDESGVWMKKQ